MFGTIARLHLKPGMEDHLLRVLDEQSQVVIPGQMATYWYKAEEEQHTYYLVAVYESKELYRANAASPEQHARYEQLRSLLVSDPDWHDGSIISVLVR